MLVTLAGNGSSTVTINVKLNVPATPPTLAGTVNAALFVQLVAAASPSTQLKSSPPAAVVLAGTVSSITPAA